MKEGFVIAASWKILKGSMLATLPILGVENPRAFYKQARAIYRREMARLPEYDMGEISNHLFLRNSTLATGGAVCDCHYVRKSAATQEEWEKCQSDKRAEALRGGRTIV